MKSRHENNKIIIEITDNGAGFDVTEPFREGAVGLNNVKFRLEHMIGGNMEIESVPGAGFSGEVFVRTI